MNTPDLPLLRADGTATTLSAYLTTPRTMVIFTRHLNWVICFSHLVQVAKAHDRFKAANCGVVVVSQGKPQVLAHFEKRNGFPFPVTGDPERVAYRAFGLERVWWWTFLFPWVLWGYLVRIVTGTIPRMPYLSEDVTQLGGNFLLDQTGKVLWSFKSGDPSRRPTVDAMLKAIGAPPAHEVIPPPHAG